MLTKSHKKNVVFCCIQKLLWNCQDFLLSFFFHKITLVQRQWSKMRWKTLWFDNICCCSFMKCFFFIVLTFVNNTYKHAMFVVRNLCLTTISQEDLMWKNSFHQKCCFSFFFFWFVYNCEHTTQHFNNTFSIVVGEFHFSHNKLKFLLRTSNVVCFFVKCLWLLPSFSISW